MTLLLGLAGWTPRVLWCTCLEAILESSWHTLHVAHASSTSGLSPLSLLAPVVLPNLGSWVTAGRACVLLDVEGSATATSAQRMSFVMTLAEGTRAFRHLGEISLALTDKVDKVNGRCW